MSSFRKQKIYTQKYRAKWEHMDEFKEWLKPLPRDITKAYCSVCNVIIKAHLCDLRKHGSAKKHMKATKLVKQLKSMNDDQLDDKSHFDFVSCCPANGWQHWDQPRSANRLGAKLDLGGTLCGWPPGTIRLKQMENDTNEPSEEEDLISDEENTACRWPAEAVECLLKHFKTFWKDFQDGLRKKKDIWEDIASAMSEDGFNISSYECGKKFRNIKLRYFSVLERTLMGESPNFRIRYFEDLHELLAKDPETIAYLEQKKLEHKPQTMLGEFSDDDTFMLEDSGYDIIIDGDMEWTESATNLLLDLLLELKEFFSGKEDDTDDTVWQMIAEQMRFQGNEVDELHCRRKWQNLVEQYTRYKSIVDSTGTVTLWPYFMKVRHVLNTVFIPPQNVNDKKPRLRKRGRRRGKKRTHSEQTPPESEAEEEPVRRAETISSETLHRMRRLTDNAELWQRLNSVETRLDELCDQQEIQRHTNSLLSQILTELSSLANHLSPRNTHDTVQLRDDITIVVPNSEN